MSQALFIKVCPHWLRSPQYRRMRRMGVESPLETLVLVWEWAINEHQGPTVDVTDLEEAAEWPGDPGDLVAALRRCGFLVDDTLVRWWDDGPGSLLEQRERWRKRKEKSRHGDTAGGHGDISGTQPVENSARIPDPQDPPSRGRPRDMDGGHGDIADVPRDMPPSHGGVTAKSRVEKSREEKKRVPSKAASIARTPARDEAPDARNLSPSRLGSTGDPAMLPPAPLEPPCTEDCPSTAPDVASRAIDGQSSGLACVVTGTGDAGGIPPSASSFSPIDPATYVPPTTSRRLTSPEEGDEREPHRPTWRDKPGDAYRSRSTQALADVIAQAVPQAAPRPARPVVESDTVIPHRCWEDAEQGAQLALLGLCKALAQAYREAGEQVSAQDVYQRHRERLNLLANERGIGASLRKLTLAIVDGQLESPFAALPWLERDLAGGDGSPTKRELREAFGG